MNTKSKLKKLALVKSVKVMQKITVAKSKKQISKLYIKHEDMIMELMTKFEEIITLEPESKQPLMCATIIANAITGFDTKAEMKIVMEMVNTTIEEFCKINKRE